MESIEERRERFAAIASALPEVEVRPSPNGQHSGARVRGKAFAYFTVDHHGDGRVAVTFKAPPGGRDALIAADPERWFWPPYMGVHGWVGLDAPASTGTRSPPTSARATASSPRSGWRRRSSKAVR